ncbi:MAG: glutamate synthase subunit beta [Lachnospiraceae bacterium]|nr:glutamate synthase subunit beta [Lachnospiraceae bacterium]
MGKSTGFLEYERKDGAVVKEADRIKNFKEFHSLLSTEEQRKQAARCMDCGVPFCQAGVKISGMISGCPLNNLVPEINDLVYRGNFAEAYRRLSITHCFPEFTSRVCPALCEHACTCGLHQEPVSTKENEKTVIEYAFSNGLVDEPEPKVRTGKKVAVIGSGPSGLAAALMLNRRGHLVTVYERSDRVGGLLRYGIPNMKLDKSVIDRRVALMEKAGITFKTNCNIGKDISGEEIKKEYDAVVLACGASHPRDISAPGRDADGIYFAVDFLKQVTKRLLDSAKKDTDVKTEKGLPCTEFTDFPYDLAEGKDVIVIGGGDTGNDCVGSCIRLKAKSVTQLEMMPEPPKERLESNPWPEWPKVLKVDYGQEEAIYKFGSDPRIYKTTVKEFKKDKKGKLKGVVLVSLESKKDEKTGRMSMVPIEGSEKEVPAQLVLIAAGFLGSESYVTESFGVEVDDRTNVKTGEGRYQSSNGKVFAAGDVHIGQSLVVRAIAEGKAAAKEVDEYLMGYSSL